MDDLADRLDGGRAEVQDWTWKCKRVRVVTSNSTLRMLAGAREKVRFMLAGATTLLLNRRFRRAHAEFPVPPLYMLWDAQSYTSYASYRKSGATAAKMYWQLFRAHATSGSDDATRAPYRVLEWGCGPARIVRHLPSLAEADGVAVEFYGTDANSKSVQWAQRNLPEVQFVSNTLAPPLPFPDHYFDFVYCRSVFTHLSEAMHFAWIDELERVVRPGGLISLSTQGVAHRPRLDANERDRFDRGERVLRTLGAEGKLMYSAFQPSQFVRERLLRGMSILKHLTPAGTQEVWVVRRTD